ncbi:mucin-2-like [Bombina bombina]|uniref:mucin-2-like n=1 Tax=Bombina bombina TaxID=8345 RepID=UPI00235A8561|nr:mucin-2-like [Bombina bombina]
MIILAQTKWKPVLPKFPRQLYPLGYKMHLSDGEVKVTKEGNVVNSPFQIHYSSIYIIIKAVNGLVLIWDKMTSIIIKATTSFQNKVCGLCGNFDGNSNNDFNTRGNLNVEDVLEFANSWKLSPKCAEVTSVLDPCTKNPLRKPWAQRHCNIILSSVFKLCHTQVDPYTYYETCVKDSCGCDEGGDCDCFCTAVAMYAQACNAACVCVEWRTQEICPVFCDYYNKEEECVWHYKACGTCLKTCRNPEGLCLADDPRVEEASNFLKSHAARHDDRGSMSDQTIISHGNNSLNLPKSLLILSTKSF